MIKVKVTKNIMKPSKAYIHFTAGQIISGAVGLLAAVGTFFLLKDCVNFTLLMWIIFAELMLIICGLIIRVNEMSLLTLLMKSLKGVEKRPYSNDKGVFDDEFSIF